MKRRQTKSRSDEYFRRSTRMKNAKMAASEQKGRLPVGRRKSVHETFLCVLVDCLCVPNFVCLRQSGRRGGHFKPLPLPFGHAHFRNFLIPNIFTEADVCANSFFCLTPLYMFNGVFCYFCLCVQYANYLINYAHTKMYMAEMDSTQKNT